MILYLSDGTGSCFASNQYIATIVKVTPNRVSKIISSLKNKNYIQVILKYKNDSKEIEQRQIIPIVQMNNGYSQNKQEGIVENNNSDSQKRQSPISESDKDIINNINDNIDVISSKNENDTNINNNINVNNKISKILALFVDKC